jgi:hypothetical protein
MELGIGAGGQGTKPHIKKLTTGLSGCEWDDSKNDLKDSIILCTYWQTNKKGRDSIENYLLNVFTFRNF